MKGYRVLWILVVMLLAGCNQYICYDGTYVEDPYSCFNHGGLSYYKVASPRAKTSTPTYQGNWNISLKTTSNTCPGIPKTISRKAVISQRSNSLTASIAGSGRYASRLVGRRARFSGTDSNICNVTYDITTDFSNTTRGTLNGTIKASCFSFFNCSVSFIGTVSR